MVNTRTAEFRKLRFESIDECLAEIARIRAADEAGTLRTTGNWTPGQTLAHVAAWIEYAYEGFPMRGPPFFVRWILRWRLPSMLRHGMPRGVRIPGAPQGTYGMDAISVPQAADRLTAAFQRLASDEPARFESPALGPMSHADRIRLNLRHAELHLGFLSC